MRVTAETVTALVNLLVAVQGAILAIYFATRRHIPPLAAINVTVLVVALSIFPLNAAVTLSRVAIGDTLLQDLSNGMLGAIGPTLYLHTRHRARGSVHVTDLVHYIPAALVLAFAQVQLGSMTLTLLLATVFVALGAYLIATAITLIRHPGSASAWLITAVISAAVVVVVNTAFKSVFAVRDIVELNSTLLFAIPIFALLFDELGGGRTSAALRSRPRASVMSGRQADEVAVLISEYLEGGAYQRPNLSVREIAQDIGVPIKAVSQVANSEIGKSVPELITSYRIEDVKRRLADPENGRYTILALAEMSGFGSGPRFNTVFREHVGMTPSEFKRRSYNSAS